MSKDFKTYSFSLLKEKDTIDLMKAFTEAVFCKSVLDFSNPKNVLTMSFNGKRNVGKSTAVKALLEAAGIEPDIRYREFFKKYDHVQNKFTIRHVDAKGLVTELIRFSEFNEDQKSVRAFLEKRKMGGIEAVEWGNSTDSCKIYKSRTDKSFKFNGYSYDYEFHLTQRHATKNEIKAWEDAPNAETFFAMSPMFQPRSLTLICSEENSQKFEFQTFLQQVDHLRIP
ncbi:MAG: hypothetical protein KDJ35_04310 [Alphaproteobacteria bacterium]|nr:hypothetical protein [Alphaproteobacteria bacterium]